MPTKNKRSVTFLSSVQDARDSENITVHLDSATLAKIDLLADSGDCGGREEFIAQAVASALEAKQDQLQQAMSAELEKKQDIPVEPVSKTVFFLGISHFGRKDFEEWKSKGKRVRIVGYGSLLLEDGIDDLIMETVCSIRVRGSVYCSERVRKAYLPNF